MLKAGALRPGEGYIFALTAKNSNGGVGYAFLNVTASVPPFGGTLHTAPNSGTTLTTYFNLSTANWTQDDTLPLVYAFVYFVGDSTFAHLRSGSTEAWCRSTLPLGGLEGYQLRVGVVAEDSVGASGSVNLTVVVNPPAISSAVGLAAAEIRRIEDKAASGSATLAALLAQSGATLLNYVLESDDDTAIADSSTALDERSNYLETMTTVAQYVDSTEAIESSAVAMELLTSVAVSTLTSSDEDNALGAVFMLVNRSIDQRSVTHQTAISTLEVLSNLVTSGILERPLYGGLSSSRSDRRTYRRRTLLSSASSPQEIIYSTLNTLGGLVGGELVTGEDPTEYTTNNIGVQILKLSRGLLRDLNGLTLHATIPSLGSAATGIPVFYLPESLLDGTGLDVGDEASLAVVMWLESPFRAIAGGNELVPGSYVSSVWVEDLNIYGLDDPVQVRLPLPPSSNLKVVDNTSTFHLNCGGSNATTQEQFMDVMSYRRAVYCNERGRVRRETSASKLIRTAQNLSRSFFCSSTPEKLHTLSCANQSGFLNFTCPKQRSVETCQHWSDSLRNWTAGNCSFWFTDDVSMTTVCNCTRLGSFSAQQRVRLEEYPLLYVGNVRRNDFSISLKTKVDARKNIGIFVLLGAVWFLALSCAGVDAYLRHRKLLNLPHMPEFNRKLRAMDAIFNDSVANPVHSGDLEAQKHARIRFWEKQYRECTINSAAREAIEAKLTKQRSIGVNWWRAMLDEYELFAFGACGERQAVHRVFVTFLCKMVAILAAVCASAPERYLCKDGSGTLKRGAFVEFPHIDGVLEYLEFVLKHRISTFLLSTLW